MAGVPLDVIRFQFPVGMSNRSYTLAAKVSVRLGWSAFNSPWECRIGLTYTIYWFSGWTRFLPFNSPWECRIGLTSFEYVGTRGRTCSSFNSPWECRIGLTYIECFECGVIMSFQFPVGMSNRSYWVLRDWFTILSIAFNSPWECRIGLTNSEATDIRLSYVCFQFPVGMSNRSYDIEAHDSRTRFKIVFQFPVGMSNRSYPLVPTYSKLNRELTFNSPWECRIGLTTTLMFRNCWNEWKSFQFPVGMSNRSYISPAMLSKYFSGKAFNSPWECRIGLTPQR